VGRPRNPEPQPGQVGVLVPHADPQIAVQRQRGPVPIGQGAFAATLAQHQQHVQVLVEVAEVRLISSSQRAPVSSSSMMSAVSRRASKPLPSHALSSRRSPSGGITGTGCSGMSGGRSLAIGLGVRFLFQPAVQHAQDLVAGRRRRRGTAGEQVGEEVLKVGAGGIAQAHATGLQEGLDLMEALQVVAHGPLGAVGGAQVALEGAEEPVRRLLVHALEGSEVR
jgi:hypothetical protein